MAAIIIGSLPTQVQTGEKFRLDLSRTFVHVGDHSLQTLEVTAGGETFDVLTEKYLDFVYDDTGEKTISVLAECGGQGHPASNKDFTITVVSESDENLFSKDNDILPYESDLLAYLPDGRGDYRYVHRIAQTGVLDSLDERGITDTSGNRLEASAIVDVEEVKSFSKFLALQYIFEHLSNSIEDIFYEKSKRYELMANKAKNRAILRLDFDGDGTIESNEKKRVFSGRLYKR